MLCKDELNARIAADRRAVLLRIRVHGEGASVRRTRSLLEGRVVRVVDSYPVRNPVQLPKIVQRAEKVVLEIAFSRLASY